MKNFVRGDRRESPGIFESLDVNAIYIFESILGTRHGLAFSGEAEF
jgi:hypothetical protein